MWAAVITNKGVDSQMALKNSSMDPLLPYLSAEFSMNIMVATQRKKSMAKQRSHFLALSTIWSLTSSADSLWLSLSSSLSQARRYMAQTNFVCSSSHCQGSLGNRIYATLLIDLHHAQIKWPNKFSNATPLFVSPSLVNQKPPGKLNNCSYGLFSHSVVSSLIQFSKLVTHCQLKQLWSSKVGPYLTPPLLHLATSVCDP